MPSERESMTFPFRWFDTLAELEENDLRAMLAAIKDYAATGQAPDFKGAMKALWNEIKQRIDYDTAKREAISAKRSECGKLGGRPRSKEKQTEAKKANGFFEKQKKPIAEAEAEAEANNNTPSSSMLTVLLDVDEPTEHSGETKKKPEKIFFDYEGDCRIHGITAEMIALWSEQFPALDIEAELKAASAWLGGNPKNRKTDVRRFLTNWLIRKQDKAPTVNTAPLPRYGRQPIDYDAVREKAAKLREMREETEA